jgi:MFS family permease
VADSEAQKATIWKDFFSPTILPFAVIGALFSVSNGIEITFLSLIGEERNIINIGFYFTFYVILLLLSKPFTGRITDQYGLKAVLYPGLILMAIESVLLGSSYTLIPILIASGCKALGQGSCHPALQTECIKRMGVAKSSLATSIFLLFTDLGQGLGPIIGGYVATKSNFSVMFYGCASLYVCALLFSNFFLYRKALIE